ncbi:Zn-ribbon domain-containing OB-fold protein [Paraburkholderia unamae]|uniref:OB-fold protein n=1 Tax=Paraburkholderia unamae TaxID=219649 RepID=A0ABX5KI02_9BURK|nr:OB-fold domain-containing protein [Paraburkholderia unamae]PVX79962.1 hypothetical protein C7402_112149 [Paraburkholderia unamae]
MTSELNGSGRAVDAPGGPEQRYFDWLASGEWRIPHCTSCSRAVFYPRIVCPFCSGRAFDWKRPSGLGTIYASTAMRRPAEAGGDLNLCLVDLDEGVRMMSRVVGVDPGAPRCGERVRAFVDMTGDTPLVLFRREENNA